MSFDVVRCAYKAFCGILRQQNILDIWENNMMMNISEIV
jgi:hypothetical protein